MGSMGSIPHEHAREVKKEKRLNHYGFHHGPDGGRDDLLHALDQEEKGGDHCLRSSWPVIRP